ncbi:MAG: YybS family protein [Treponema sp.]|jgi:hypothetical protein|nr:YybS family protein [Treponema sp.]
MVPGKALEGVAYVPALIGAVVCVGLIRSGFPAFFFLVPLGFMAYGYNRVSTWFALAVAVMGNGIFSLGLFLFFVGYHGWDLGWDVAYFTLMAVVFTWITAPPVKGPWLLRIPGAYRFIAGSVIGAVGFMLVVYTARDTTGFHAFMRTQAEMLRSLYVASSGTDVVRRSLVEQYLTPEAVMETLSFVLLRGGGAVSCLLIFFISRQISLVLARIFRHSGPGSSLMWFHTAPLLIWVLSCSLLGVLAGGLANLVVVEIIAWNMVILCAILYLAQGGGIVMHFLNRRALPPLMRLGLNGLIIFLIFSPGINVVALGGVILLGIAENWVPFRASQSDGPSSTPGM